jgi:hypothetical protein
MLIPDVIFIAVVLAFFGLCALYVRGCERILSSGEESTDSAPEVTQ